MMQFNNCQLLTACIITYNQEEYIERAVVSVLMQVTDFNFNIAIADDYSTDGTRLKLLKLKDQFPEKITLLLQDENIGAAKNWLQLLEFPKSKYIAYLEGDDYWTCNQKLQKQVDFLEKNIEYSLCFHDVWINNMSTNTKSKFPIGSRSIFRTSDVLMRSWFCPSGSIVFRSDIVSKLPRNINKFPNGDILLLFVASTSGALFKINEIMGVYNYLSVGSMSSNFDNINGSLQKLRRISRTITEINKLTSNKYLASVVIKKIKINILFLVYYFKYYSDYFLRKV